MHFYTWLNNRQEFYREFVDKIFNLAFGAMFSFYLVKETGEVSWTWATFVLEMYCLVCCSKTVCLVRRQIKLYFFCFIWILKRPISYLSILALITICCLHHAPYIFYFIFWKSKLIDKLTTKYTTLDVQKKREKHVRRGWEANLEPK